METNKKASVETTHRGLSTFEESFNKHFARLEKIRKQEERMAELERRNQKIY